MSDMAEQVTHEQIDALIASLGDFSKEPPPCVAAMRTRFNDGLRGKGAAGLPAYFEATLEEIDAYRDWRWPNGLAWVITGPDGHRGIPFKGVPLTLADGKEYL